MLLTKENENDQPTKVNANANLCIMPVPVPMPIQAMPNCKCNAVQSTCIPIPFHMSNATSVYACVLECTGMPIPIQSHCRCRCQWQSKFIPCPLVSVIACVISNLMLVSFETNLTFQGCAGTRVQYSTHHLSACTRVHVYSHADCGSTYSSMFVCFASWSIDCPSWWQVWSWLAPSSLYVSKQDEGFHILSGLPSQYWYEYCVARTIPVKPKCIERWRFRLKSQVGGTLWLPLPVREDQSLLLQYHVRAQCCSLDCTQICLFWLRKEPCTKRPNAVYKSIKRIVRGINKIQSKKERRIEGRKEGRKGTGKQSRRKNTMLMEDLGT